MTKEAGNYWLLMTVLVTIVLTSFTVQSILSPEASELKLSAEITGNAIEAVADEEPDGFNEVLTRVAGWIEGS